jgi:hypothetical protein
LKPFRLSFLFLITFFWESATALGQGRNLRGKVLDAETRQPLPGAQVAHPFGKSAVFSDSIGAFSIKVLADTGIIRISCRYDSLLPLSQDRMGAKIGNVWGFLDRDERIRIQPNFEFIQPFKDSLCLVKQDGKWGLLKLNGQLELSCHFDYITQTSSGKWILKRGDWMGIADIKGKILLNTRYSNIIEAPPDLIRVERDGRTGLFNSKGNALLLLEFSRILPDYIHRILIAR